MYREKGIKHDRMYIGCSKEVTSLFTPCFIPIVKIVSNSYKTKQVTYTTDFLKYINSEHLDFIEQVHSIMSNTPIRRNQHGRNIDLYLLLTQKVDSVLTDRYKLETA